MKVFCALLTVLVLFAGCSIEISEEPSSSNTDISFAPISSQPATAVESSVQEEFGNVQAALTVLIEASSADDKKQQMAAYTWLCKQGSGAIDPVVATMNDETLPIAARRHACRVLGHLGEGAADPLIAASKSDNTALKLRAIETFPAIEPMQKPIVDRLIVLLDDPSDQVRHTAIRSLGHIGPAAKASADKLNALRDDVDQSETTRHEAGKSLKLVRPIRSFED